VLTVGLTGGVASGKSTVARLLAAHGAAVIDADAVVEGLYGPGQPGTAAVVGLFGEGVLAADGSVDRSALGLFVLADPKARRSLEDTVHPLVVREIAVWLGSLSKRPSPPRVAVIEAALLVETGRWRDYDRLVLVVAPVEVRRGRALAAGWAPERFEAVVAAQAGDAERERVASFVVHNDGDLAALAAAVDDLWERLTQAGRITPLA